MGSAYIMVVLGIVMAKGLGFFRDIVFAEIFGTGVLADIYFQVFGLVTLIFTGIGVALSTLVIKNINKTENIGKEKAYVSYFIKKAFLYLVAAVAVMAVLAPQIVNVILPNIGAEDNKLAIQLFYVMLPSLVFVVIAYIISGVLQNERAFFVTAVMSVPYNVIIILTLYLFDASVLTIGAVTTLGWFLHIAILLPSFYKKQYTLLSRDKYISKSEGNMEILWIFISNMMFQVCLYTDRAFVSGNEGMAATFNYASNLFITISSVFVVAMSTVVFPAISKNYEENNIDYVNETLRYIITVMTAIFLPFLLVVGLFGTNVIGLLYERGSFTAQSTTAVAIMFLVYSMGILGYTSQELFNKILYLAGKYNYSVAGTVAVVVLNAVINVLIAVFVPGITLSGTYITLPSLCIAITTSALMTGYAVLMAIGMKKVVGSYWKKDLVVNIGKIFVSGALAAGVYAVFNVFMKEFTHGTVTFIIPLCVCGGVYIVALLFTGVLKQLIKK